MVGDHQHEGKTCTGNELRSDRHNTSEKDLSSRKMNRFSPPVSRADIDQLINSLKSRKSKNTWRTRKWSMEIFNKWRLARCARNGIPVPELAEMDLKAMDFWLQRFVLEACGQNGVEYPPRSLYAIFCGLLRTLRNQPQGIFDKNFLDDKDGRFTVFRKVLGARMNKLQKKDLGAIVKQAEPISSKKGRKDMGQACVRSRVSH